MWGNGMTKEITEKRLQKLNAVFESYAMVAEGTDVYVCDVAYDYSRWSKKAVEWAVQSGLMAGNADGDLMLRSPLTREQFCVMLKRYHDFCGKQNNQRSTY